MGTMTIPSLFANASTKSTKPTKSLSYLKRPASRKQVSNVLASVDSAIEDGATTQAKSKASAERAASEAPVPVRKQRSRSKSASGRREPRRVSAERTSSKSPDPSRKYSASTKKASSMRNLNAQERMIRNRSKSAERREPRRVSAERAGSRSPDPAKKYTTSTKKASSMRNLNVQEKRRSRSKSVSGRREPRRVSAERTSSKSPDPAKKYKKSSSSRNLEERARTRSKSRDKPRRSKSTDNKQSRVRAGKKIKSKSVDPSDVPDALAPDDHSVKSLKSLLKKTPKKSNDPTTPAWKARLLQQEKNGTSPVPPESSTSKVKTPKSSKSTKKTPKSAKRILKKTDPKPNSFLAPPLTIDDPKELMKPNMSTDKPKPLLKPSLKIDDPKKLMKPKKKEKKEKKSNRPSIKDDFEGIENVFNNDDVLLRSSRHQMEAEAELKEQSIVNLRRQIEETRKKLNDVRSSTIQEKSDMEKDYKDTKEAIRLRILKLVHVQAMKNDEKQEAYKEVLDANQREIDEMRTCNQRLRNEIQKLPKKMSELIFANQSLEDANKDIAGHIESLSKFDKKLQADQERLYHSNDKCKNQYLPKYRQQLWQGKQHLDSETKAKELYREVIIKITKRLEKSKQPKLLDEVSSMVVETEGEVNPKFDPKFLSSAPDVDVSDAELDDDSDSSDSSYSSSDSDSEF